LAFIETGETTKLSSVADLSKLDDSHKGDKAWDWFKFGVGSVTDVVALGKVAKLVKTAPTYGQMAWGAIKESFVPDWIDYSTTGVDIARGDSPSMDWLTGLIPIYGTYQTYLDATSKKPLGVFVGN
jgi:hypothetical protein